ncbi:unnamed protein product [Caenorhabditis sp. 36 PRJEB53466]|nr:unnamed protein product [Caenorhabditis sp. 36 PRJEB53466]
MDRNQLPLVLDRPETPEALWFTSHKRSFGLSSRPTPDTIVKKSNTYSDKSKKSFDLNSDKESASSNKNKSWKKNLLDGGLKIEKNEKKDCDLASKETATDEKKGQTAEKSGDKCSIQ